MTADTVAKQLTDCFPCIYEVTVSVEEKISKTQSMLFFSVPHQNFTYLHGVQKVQKICHIEIYSEDR